MNQDEEYHMLNLLHAIYIVMDSWERHVCEWQLHEQIHDEFPGIKQEADRIQRTMLDLFNAVEKILDHNKDKET